jgi:large subunit ribosomal protein L4
MENQEFFETGKKKKAIGLIHRVYLSLLKNARKYTASTKTKSEVRGGGRKPWRQKGTGNARAGSIRSPLWKGGGVIFGPKPRIVKKKINKKERRLAILSAFYLKETRLIKISDQFFKDFEDKKTKNIVSFVKTFDINNEKKILFILPESNKNFWLATRNLKNIDIATAKSVNLFQLLHAEYIFLSNLSFTLINEIYGTKNQ